MRIFFRLIIIPLICGRIFLLSNLAFGESQDYEGYIPTALEPWKQWVRESDADYKCARLGDTKNCYWQGELSVEVSNTGAQFYLKVVLDRDGFISLPGGESWWPLDVRAESRDSHLSPLVLNHGSPVTYLSAGQWVIFGRFNWKIKPSTLIIPQGAALVSLVVDGQKVLKPKIDDNGTLWLGDLLKQNVPDISSEITGEAVALTVLRKFEDGVPIKLETIIKLAVSGKVRTLDLGRVLPAGFSIVRIESALPYQLPNEDKLILQVGAGRHEIKIFGYSLTSLTKIQALQTVVASWPSNETWVWVSDSQKRAVQVEDVSAIDPARTEIPISWRRYPTYQVIPGMGMSLREIRRGEVSVSPNDIVIDRTIWLNEVGDGFISQDNISGTLSRSFRLNAAKDNLVGGIVKGGQNLLITIDPSTKERGVEIRDQNINLIAMSEIKDRQMLLSATGWNEDAKSLSVKLMLPPGWKLFHATGIRDFQNTWLGSWTLLDIFVVLLVAIATYKVMGRGVGVLAGAMLVLVHGEPSQPFYIWIFLVGVTAILGVVPEGKTKSLFKYFDLALKCLLALIVTVFCLNEFRDLLYPQLSMNRDLSSSSFDYLGQSGMTYIGLFLIKLILGIWFFVLLYRRAWAKAFMTLGALGIVLLIGGLFAVSGVRQGAIDRGLQHSGEEFKSEELAVAPQALPARPEVSMDRIDTEGAQLMRKSKSRAVGATHEPDQTNVITPQGDEYLQTGPATPQWSHRAYFFNWQSPVKKDHQIGFYLISPVMNFFLTLIRVLVVVMLSYCFYRTKRLYLPKNVMMGLIAAIVICPKFAQAQNYPPREILDDLKHRLEREECYQDCTKAQLLNISIVNNVANFSFEIHSKGLNSYALPGPVRDFRPSKVSMDGAEYNAVIKKDDGFLWTRIPDGVHRIEFEISLSGLNSAEFEFVDKPGNVIIQSKEWYQEGINENNSLVGKTLRLVRQEGIEKNVVEKSTKGENIFALGSWFTIRRDLNLGNQWKVNNIAEREGLTDRAEFLTINLIDGEKVNDRNIKVEDGKAVVSFPVGVRRVEWISLLSEREKISLMANDDSRLSERWKVFCSAIYQCSYQGIPPITSVQGGISMRSFEPWPKEVVEIITARPKAAPGVSTTIESVGVEYNIGESLVDTILRMQITTTTGGFQSILIPSSGEIESVEINGRPSTITSDKGRLQIPLSIGKQTVQIVYRDAFKEGMMSRMAELNLGNVAANLNYRITVPENRWLIWTFGPKWGPVILFWPKLILIMFLSVLAGRFIPVKVGYLNWLLLGFGFATLPLAYIALLPVWLVVLHSKDKLFGGNKIRYNIGQIVLVVLTVGVLASAYLAVAQGLVVAPDMGILGSGSTGYNLHWYADKTEAILPMVGFLSLPLFAYRLVMLLWSLWFASSLISWLKFGWGCFAKPSFWNRDLENKSQ